MMIDENDHMLGGFTIRTTRENLKTEKEKKEYDEYIGIKSYEPIWVFLTAVIPAKAGIQRLSSDVSISESL